MLAPLLEEMEEMQVRLTAKEFLGAVDRLLDTLSIVERRQLLWPARPPEQGCPHSFEPRINERSRMLADDRKGDLYQVGQSWRQESQARLARLRASLDQLQMQECSFQPCIR